MAESGLGISTETMLDIEICMLNITLRMLTKRIHSLDYNFTTLNVFHVKTKLTDIQIDLSAIKVYIQFGDVKLKLLELTVNLLVVEIKFWDINIGLRAPPPFFDINNISGSNKTQA